MKSVFKMSGYELVQHEARQGNKHGTSDLETALADKLSEAMRLLTIATAQLQDYSENEFVISPTGDDTSITGDDTSISELMAFCEVAGL